MDAEAYLRATRALVDAALDRLLPQELTAPATLHRAMRYSVFAGGKRLRPALALAAGRLGDLDDETLAPAAAALELVHTYSLIHDDLPAMDDDDLRRGRATCHVVFGEAQAILAGDALLTLAFEVLAAEPPGAGLAPRRLGAIALVARAAGPAGMVGGQTADLEASGPDHPAVALDRVRFIHERKTGALLGASVALGALLSGVAAAEVERLETSGRHLGLAFQIADDILDLESDAEALGKTPGKDQKDGKLTYPAAIGVAASRREAERLVAEAEALLDGFGEAADLLRALGRFVVTRRS